jgi:hypothetical protein
LPNEIEDAAKHLAEAYANCSIRPRLPEHVLGYWDTLIDQWSNSEDLPLLVRKQSADIGDLLTHEDSGRRLAPCDNSPAHWAILTAFNCGTGFTLDDVEEAVAHHEVPVTMVMNAKEIAESKMKGVGAKLPNASKLGWKVDHIVDVGLGGRGRIEEMPLDDLKRHFCRLMKPSNIVLVPRKLRGLGDMPAFISFLKTSAL